MLLSSPTQTEEQCDGSYIHYYFFGRQGEQALSLYPPDSGDPAASDKGQHVDLNAFELITRVFHSGIPWAQV